MAMSSDRSVRIFLSSTFRDFGEERDLLVRRVFPSLRSKLRDRFVEIVDVDLRWGITVEQAERGEVLPICLAEIDRARPFFVGMLGERYGWVPPRDAYAPDLIERQPWLEAHRGGRSVTELEVLHGVLNDPRMAGRALFYFRAPDYARAKGGDYVAASAEDKAHQTELKERIRRSGFPVLEDYPNPEAFAQRLERDLWSVLDEAFPAAQVPDAFAREEQRHEAYAAPRRRLYLGGERYIAALSGYLAEGCQRVLIEGQSGGGKSALLANWLEAYRQAHPADLVHVHYTGATADAADPHGLVRRLCEAIKRTAESTEEIPVDPQKLLDSLPLWLGLASAYAGKENTRWVIVLDALNGITELKDLRWFQKFLPERVHVVVSCLPGQVLDALKTKGNWTHLLVEPLTGAERAELLRSYLARYNKTLPADLAKQALGHPLASNPLFLLTLAEELRLFGVHEELKERLSGYLASETVDDLFERVLARVEVDCGAKRVRSALEAIWGSRAGLTEQEILGLAELVPATWAPIRHALDDAFLESGGRLCFAHDYLRIAVSDRYLEGNGMLAEEGQSEAALVLRRALHERLARWFDDQAFQRGGGIVTPGRAAREVPYHWRAAAAWESLRACLTRQEMFEELYLLDKAELSFYWDALYRSIKSPTVLEYQAAWQQWDLEKNSHKAGDLAHRLATFLHTERSEYDNEFVVYLTKYALQNARKTSKNIPKIIRRIDRLAWLFYLRDDLNKALRYQRFALRMANNLLEKKDMHMSLWGHNNLGLILLNMERYEQAKEVFEELLINFRIINSNQYYKNPDLTNIDNEFLDEPTILLNYAAVLQDSGDFTGAAQSLRQALAIVEKIEGVGSTRVRLFLHYLGVNLREIGKFQEAEAALQRAHRLAEDFHGTDSDEVASALSALGRLWHMELRLDDAAQALKRSLEIRISLFGPADSRTKATQKRLDELRQGNQQPKAATP